MDSFENVITSLLEREGFWTRTSVKVELTDVEKKKIGWKTNPRPEFDIVAYKGKTNELWLVECKSYLNSGGVNYRAFNGTNPGFAKRFKLFNKQKKYRLVRKILLEKLVEAGFCRPNPKVSLVLVAGNVVESHREKLKSHFDKKGWILWDEKEWHPKLKKLAGEGYENSIVSVVSKMLLRRTDK